MPDLGFPEGSYDKETREMVDEGFVGQYEELRKIIDTIATSSVKNWREAFPYNELMKFQLWKVRCCNKSCSMKLSISPNVFVLQFRVIALLIYTARKQSMRAGWPEAYSAFEAIVGTP